MTQTARLYGDSLYELAVEEQLEETMIEQLKEVRQLFRENPDYLSLLSEPSIPKKDRTEMIEAAFGTQAQRYLVNFLKILCERGILREFSGCVEEFTRRYYADHNIAEAVVTGAVRLTDDQMNRLQARLEQISGKKISLVQKIDPSVLGGLRVELEGKLMDGTISGRLSGVSRKLGEVIV
ncbi:MAG: ATP synthase F1 subunit delta [Eubacteriales bacterium]|nr:ATP synthase F1 subunit delta [Eubacteriales bacterium]